MLFPDKPEFHATYKLLNVKNHNLYTDKFVLNVIDLTCIHLATEQDRLYGTDKWAAFFKAKTWEELKMLTKQMPSLQSSVETLYQLNADEQIRETCDRFLRAEARERGYEKFIAKQAREIEKKDAQISEQASQLSEKNAQISEQEKEIATLKARLAEHGIPSDLRD